MNLAKLFFLSVPMKALGAEMGLEQQRCDFESVTHERPRAASLHDGKPALKKGVWLNH